MPAVAEPPPLALPAGLEGALELHRLLGIDLPDHHRRILEAFHGPEREVVVVIPRGNGKTSIAARAALAHLLSVPNASVALGSGTREQANYAFQNIVDDLEHPAINALVDVRVNSMRARAGGMLRVVSGRGHRAHGRTDSVMVCDEAWSQDGSLLEAFETSLVKRRDARLWIVSTAAPTLDSPLGQLRNRAMALPNARRDGAIVTASGNGLRWLEFSIPDDADANDLDTVKLANPADWLAPLAEQRARCTDTAWLTLHCGRWGANMASWLPTGAWAACETPGLEVGLDEPLFLGCDIGGIRHASALVGVTADLRVGHVTVLEGDDSVLGITDAILELQRSGQAIAELVYDEWNFRAEALRLERDTGLRVVEFPQRRARLAAASAVLHAAVVEQRLRHPGDPDLDQHVHTAVARQHDDDVWRIARPKGDPDAKIDACSALMMAVERASAPKPKPVRVLGIFG